MVATGQEIVREKKNSSPPPRRLEFPGGWGFRFCKAKKIEKKFMKLNWDFQRGGGVGWGLRKSPFCGGGMDIFWNCTI